MTIRSIGEFHPVPERPGMRTRALIATEQGFVVTEGAVTIQLGEETITPTAGSVVRIPPGVPHALRNQAIDSARVLGAAAWNRVDFFREATRYLEGVPRKE